MRFAHRAQDPDFRANRGLAANIVKVNFSTAVILSPQHQTEARLLTFPNFTTTPPLSLRRSREGGNPVSLAERRWIPAFAGTTEFSFGLSRIPETSIDDVYR